MKNTTRIGIVLAISFGFFTAEIAGKDPPVRIGSMQSLSLDSLSGVQDEESGSHC